MKSILTICALLTWIIALLLIVLWWSGMRTTLGSGDELVYLGLKKVCPFQHIEKDKE